MVKVFLFKEQVYSIDDDLLPSFRKLCEQVGYRTHYNRSNFSLYLKPWLDGKQIVVQVKKDNKKEIISRLENLLTPYGASIETSANTKGDLFLYIQSSNQEKLEILYSSSYNEGGKELANSLYTSFLEHEPMKIVKPISLWNPFSHDKQKKLLGKTHCPAVIINLPSSISIEDLTQGILQGILNYFKVPILLPQNNTPKIWEQIILQVLEIKKQELFCEKEPVQISEPQPPIQLKHTPEPKPEPEPVFQAQSVPEPEPEPLFQAQSVPEPEPEPVFQAQFVPKPEPEPLFQAQFVPEREPIPVEKLPPLEKAIPEFNKGTKSPQEIVQERIKELQMQIKTNPAALNSQTLLMNQDKLHQAKMNQARINQASMNQASMNQARMNQDPWDALKSHPNWNQSSLMKKPPNNANGPIINPFKQKKPQNNQNLNTVNPFGKGKR